MTTIKIGGVPEHFNLPIHLAIENGDFAKENIQIEWTDFGGGTGAMTKALRSNECDICILLTEGIIADILKGNPSKIIGAYVESPLIWGIHTQSDNEMTEHTEIYDKKIAISRFGSGSHLMPIVDAMVNKQNISEEQFVVIKNLQGAFESLGKRETEVFYWEKFTTKPHLEQQNMKRLSEFPTPWACFMVAATENILAKEAEAVKKVVEIIHNSCKEFMQNKKAVDMVSDRYGIEKEDAQTWFSATKWATNSQINHSMLNQVVESLFQAGIIEEKSDAERLL